MLNSTQKIRGQNLASMMAAGEGARQVAGIKEAADTAQERVAMNTNTSLQTLAAPPEQSVGSAEASGRQEELAEHQCAVEAVTGCSAILVSGFQEVSRQWMRFAQERWQKNLEGVEALLACQTIEEVVATQTELICNSIHDILDNSRTIAETSAKVSSEAAQSVATP
jgi:hypothetical protein